MKVIHVMTNNLRKPINELEYEFGKLSIITAFLSVLKWKSYGFTTKLYVDSDYKEYFDRIGLLEMYDEVDDTFLNDSDSIYEAKEISKSLFWSFSKLFVLEKETEPIIISDMDFVPFEDYNKFVDKKCFAFYKEPLTEDYYPSSPDKYLELKPDYQFPDWYDWKCNSYNCAVLYINEPSLKELYLNQAYEYAKGINNTLTERTLTNNIHVLFAEQKMINICAKHLGIDITETIVENGSKLINETVCHLSIYKMIDNESYEKSLNWILSFMKKLNEVSVETYNKLVSLDIFKEYHELLISNDYKIKKPMALKLVKW